MADAAGDLSATVGFLETILAETLFAAQMMVRPFLTFDVKL
jgi:hypothetical protein